MAWNIITTDDIKSRLAGAELNALQTAALADGQVDPTPEIIAQAIDEVRGYVAAGGNTLGLDGTVPSKLKLTTLNIIRYRLCSRLPVASLLTESRIKEYDDAVRLLEQVAAKKFAVEEPTVAATEQAGASSPRFNNSKVLVYSPENQEGI
jgi:phage gp36-like protein